MPRVSNHEARDDRGPAKFICDGPGDSGREPVIPVLTDLPVVPLCRSGNR